MKRSEFDDLEKFQPIYIAKYIKTCSGYSDKGVFGQPFGWGMPTLCLLHYCILEANNIVSYVHR